MRCVYCGYVNVITVGLGGELLWLALLLGFGVGG